MTLTEKIIKGITEVEFEINPELQKQQPWPTPKLTGETAEAPTGGANVSTQITDDPNGDDRFRYTVVWPNGSYVEVVEKHTKHGAELNLWAPTSNIPKGSWAKAIKSIKDHWQFPKGFYVYVPSMDDPIFQEINAVSSFVFLTDEQPGTDDVADHFQGYEAVPASQQSKPFDPGEVVWEKRPPKVELPEPKDGASWLMPWAKANIATHNWIDVMSLSSKISSSNPVTITVDYIDNGQTGVENKEFVGDILEDYSSIEGVWAPGQNGWRLWPSSSDFPMVFNESVVNVIKNIDKSIAAWVSGEDDAPTGDEVDKAFAHAKTTDGAPPILSAGNKFEMNKRSWITIHKKDEEVTEENPVRIMVNNIPLEGDTYKKRVAVYEKIEELHIAGWWDESTNSWLMHSASQGAKAFNKQINDLMSAIDELIYAGSALEPEPKEEPKEVYQVWVDHPNWQSPVKHGGDYSTIDDAVESAKAWQAQVKGPGNKNKSAKFKKGYSYKVTGADGTIWGEG